MDIRSCLGKGWSLCKFASLNVVEKMLLLPLDLNSQLLSCDWAAPPLLPPREGLKLGERTMAYLPRCADISAEIRKVSTQVVWTAALSRFSFPCVGHETCVIVLWIDFLYRSYVAKFVFMYYLKCFVLGILQVLGHMSVRVSNLNSYPFVQ